MERNAKSDLSNRFIAKQTDRGSNAFDHYKYQGNELQSQDGDGFDSERKSINHIDLPTTKLKVLAGIKTSKSTEWAVRKAPNLKYKKITKIHLWLAVNRDAPKSQVIT